MQNRDDVQRQIENVRTELAALAGQVQLLAERIEELMPENMREVVAAIHRRSVINRRS